MIESRFQAKLIREIKERFEGVIVLKNDAQYIQGFPDLLVLYNDRWAALECKRSNTDPFQPNQEYYLDLLNRMSFARMINPDNKEEVLHELQLAFRLSRTTRFSRT